MADSSSKQLREAIRHGNIAGMRAAIEAGADANGRDDNGRTALHYAASAGRIEALDVVLDAGAMELQDDRGDTPSHSAASAGRLSCAMRLMERGADPSIRNKLGRRAIHEAMRAGHASVVRLIEEAVCPFRAKVVHNTSFLWIFDTSCDVWMVVHKAQGPGDKDEDGAAGWDEGGGAGKSDDGPPGEDKDGGGDAERDADRSANRVQLFAGRDAASHSVEVLNARVVRVTPGPKGNQVVLEGSGREVELCMTRQQSDWLTFVLGGSFASGTGPNFDSMGNVVQPAWMLSQNVHFPAGGAAKPPAAEAPDAAAGASASAAGTPATAASPAADVLALAPYAAAASARTDGPALAPYAAAAPPGSGARAPRAAPSDPDAKPSPGTATASVASSSGLGTASPSPDTASSTRYVAASAHEVATPARSGEDQASAAPASTRDETASA